MSTQILTATNTWGLGLVMDSAPDNTLNTVLTSALNATLVTYNGNEYSLQNDMGNGRVETARLPEGYIPVGSCELGGIIYIASYNPLTGKSQLGSFPSPERNITSDEVGTLEQSIKYTDFQNENLDGRLNQISKLYDLNLYLNAGDLFYIYTSEDIDLNMNRYMDVSIVTLDDNNSVTKLKKGKIEELIEKVDITLDNNSLDIDDYRNLVDYSVFSVKRSGKLCILVELKTLLNFNVKVDYDVDDNKPTAILDINYDSLDCLKGFKITYEGSPDIFIEKTNTYNLGSSFSTEETLVTITPVMEFGIIDSQAITVTVNLGKAGSGLVDFTEWRYYTLQDSSLLKFSIEAYPLPKHKIINLALKFYDYEELGNDGKTLPNESNFSIEYSGLDNYNGIYSEEIYFGQEYDSEKFNGILNKNKLYLVSIEYVMLGNSKEITVKNYKWFYTNTLFNKYYLDPNKVDFSELYPELELELSTNYTANSNVETVTEISEFLSHPVSEDKKYYQYLGVQSFSKNYTIGLGNTVTLKEDYYLFSKLIDLNHITVSVDTNKSIDSSITLSDVNIISEKGTPEDLDVLYLTPIIEGPKEREGTIYSSEENYKNYTDWCSASFSEDGKIKIKGESHIKIQARMTESNRSVNVLRPLVYNTLTAHKYGFTIVTDSEGNNKLESTSNNHFPAACYYSKSGKSNNDFLTSVCRLNDNPADKPSASSGQSTGGINLLTVSMFNDTNMQILLSTALELSVGKNITITPFLYGFYGDDDSVFLIGTKSSEGHNKDFCFRDNDTMLRTINEAANLSETIQKNLENNFYIMPEKINEKDYPYSGVQALTFDYAKYTSDWLNEKSVMIWGILMKDIEDNIIPLNYFSYYYKDAKLSIYSSYSDKSSEGAIIGTSYISFYAPILALLTQVFKVTEQTFEDVRVIDYLIYPEKYLETWEFNIPIVLEGSNLVDSKYGNWVENLAEISNNLKFKINGLDYGDLNKVSKEYKLILNQTLDPSTLINKYIEKKKSTASVCIPAYKGKKEYHVNILSYDNTLYYMDKENLKEMDSNFKLYDYVPEIEIDGDNIYTKWYPTDTENNTDPIDTIGNYLTLGDDGLLRIKAGRNYARSLEFHVRGLEKGGWFDTNYHVNWGFDRDLKIRKEYAR